MIGDVYADVLSIGDIKSKLDEIIKENHIQDPKIDINIATEKGDNFSGKIYKIEIVGRDNETNQEKKLNFILKIAVESKFFRDNIKIQRFYEREVFLYTQVLPLFEQMQDEKGIKRIFNSYTKVYKCSIKDQEEFVLMDNEKLKGFQMTDRKKPLDVNHCELVFKELGKYHALSFAFKKYNREKLEELKTRLDDNFIYNGNEHFMREHYETKGEKALTTLQPEHDTCEIEKFKIFAKEIYNILAEIAEPENSGEYFVITYGDCWSNNILFKYGNPEHPELPTELRFLDWQLSRYASPVIDLSYFTYNCTGTEMRHQHFKKLLDLYYSTLSESLKLLGCDVSIEYPRDIFNKHLKKYFKYGLSMSCANLFYFTTDSDQIPDFDNVEDFNFESKNVHLYNERMRGVIKHAVENEFI